MEDEHTDNNKSNENDHDGVRDRRHGFYNVIVVGIAFMFIFTAFQTCSMIEESVLSDVRKESGGSFTGSGYTSLAIIYAVFAISNWAAPSIVSLIGPRLSMLSGGIIYGLFILSFLKPMTWSLYTGSALLGIGAAVIWTAQGNFLAINSNPDTVARNSGIFWALFQCSLVFGNIYVYFEFKGKVEIVPHTRTIVYIVLSTTCGVGLLFLLFLRKSPFVPQQQVNEGENKTQSMLNGFVSALKLIKTPDMLIISICFAYTGLELTFFSGVYGTSVGNNSHFPNPKSLLGIVGIFIGLGEIIGGGTFGIFGKQTVKHGRDPIVLFGLLCHLAAYYMIFLNQPMDSPLETSESKTFIHASEYIAIVCAFLLGLGDSCFNTQIYSYICSNYLEKSAEAFAIFKFTQSLAAAVGFFYSDQLSLQWQLLILVIMAFFGAWSFFVVEWRTKKIPADYRQL